MLKLVVTLSIFFTGIQSLIAQAPAIVHKSYAERAPLLYDFYDKCLADGRTDSAGAYEKIDSIASLARQAGDDALLTETAYMRMYYHSLRENNHASRERLIHSLDSLRQVADRKKYLWLAARVEMCYIDIYFRNNLNYELGFVHYSKLDEILKQLSASEFPEIQNYYYKQGTSFYHFNRWERAIAYYTRAIHNTPAAFPYNTNVQLILNNCGLAYQHLRQFDSSDHYFRKVLASIEGIDAHNKEVWTGIASGNLGYSQFLQKHYTAAKPLLETDVRIAEQNKSWRLAVGSLVPLAEIALAENRVGEATVLAAKAREYATRANQFRRWEIVYPLLTKIAAYQGNGLLASRYYDSAIMVKDSLNSQYKSMQLTLANQRIAYEKHEAELVLLDTERKLKLLERNMLLAGLLALALLLVYVYRRQMQKVNAKQLALARTELELEEASTQLDIFTRHIAEKNKLIDNLLEQANGLQTEVMEQLRQSSILTDEDWRNFQLLYEKAHPGFFDRIRRQMPGLSPGETRYIVLSKLGMGTKDMSAMLGIGSEAIRQYRLRLRKKLQLTEEDNLEELVKRI